MSAIFLLIALASSAPAINIDATCQAARDAALPEDRAGAYQSCVRDEQSARDQIQSKWTKYSASAHAACAETGGFSLSYAAASALRPPERLSWASKASARSRRRRAARRSPEGDRLPIRYPWSSASITSGGSTTIRPAVKSISTATALVNANNNVSPPPSGAISRMSPAP